MQSHPFRTILFSNFARANPLPYRAILVRNFARANRTPSSFSTPATLHVQTPRAAFVHRATRKPTNTVGGRPVDDRAENSIRSLHVQSIGAHRGPKWSGQRLNLVFRGEVTEGQLEYWIATSLHVQRIGPPIKTLEAADSLR